MGLAATVASALAEDGFGHVAITYRTTPPDATCRAIEAAGAHASALRLDFLGDPDAIQEVLDGLVRSAGPFDTLVHAVGPLVVTRFARAGLAQYDVAFDGNVRSAVLAAGAVLPAMRAAKFGRIVFFGALGAAESRPFARFALYQSAKSAVVAFARCLALEEAGAGITVNVVSPGDIREKTLGRNEALQRTARNPRGRPGSARDVADVVRFLVSVERDFITGANIEVTGGLQTPSE